MSSIIIAQEWYSSTYVHGCSNNIVSGICVVYSIYTDLWYMTLTHALSGIDCYRNGKCTRFVG